MEKKKSGLHKIALAALFTVGNALIRYPWRGSDRSVLPVFLLSVVGALIPAILIYPLFRWIWRRPISLRRGRMLVVGVLSAFFCAYALFCAWRSCADYVLFSMDLILPRGSRWLLALLFVSCAVWLSEIGDRRMDSFSLLAFLGVILVVVFLFLVGLPHFEWQHVAVKPLQWEWGSFGGMLALWRESLLPLSVLALYFALVVPKGGGRSLAAGTVIGCAILFLCVVQTILTFGTTYAAQLDYPYSFAVRILSVGQYFFRLEGFSYLLDYLTCLVRASVALSVSKRLLGRFLPRLSRNLSLVAGGGLLLILWIQ